jgi:hypothetical protein
MGSLNSLVAQANTFGFQCQNVPGDGNCFFHAVLDQLKRTDSECHAATVEDLRERAVQHILDHFVRYEKSIGEDPNVFMGKIMQGGEWADHLIIQALSRALNITIVIIRSDAANPIIIRGNDSAKTIYLGYEVGWHYQSLVINSALIPVNNISEFIQRTDIDTFNAVETQPAQFSVISTSVATPTVTASAGTSSQATLVGKQGIFKAKVELPSQKEAQFNYALVESRKEVASRVNRQTDDDDQTNKEVESARPR